MGRAPMRKACGPAGVTLVPARRCDAVPVPSPDPAQYDPFAAEYEEHAAAAPYNALPFTQLTEEFAAAGFFPALAQAGHSRVVVSRDRVALRDRRASCPKRFSWRRRRDHHATADACTRCSKSRRGVTPRSRPGGTRLASQGDGIGEADRAVPGR